MNNLVEKYRRLSLTKEDLLLLRETENHASDEEIAIEMQEHWEDDIDEGNVPEEAIETIQERIDEQIQPQFTLRRRIGHVLQYAAMIMLPICLVVIGYLAHQQKSASDDMLTVSTHQGEQVSLRLPDGTQVKLNEQSSVSYSPYSFSVKKREIDFRGEAYFDVRHDTSHPFNIYVSGARVKVTGTKFNLVNYSHSLTMELCLFEGSVSVKSSKTGKEIMVKPNQKCILNKATGEFKIDPIEESSDFYTAWMRHELVFRSMPISQVIEKIGQVYGVSMQLKGINGSDLFTGVLPMNDFNKCLVVLSNLYDCRIQRHGNIVILARKKKI